VNGCPDALCSRDLHDRGSHKPFLPGNAVEWKSGRSLKWAQVLWGLKAPPAANARGVHGMKGTAGAPAYLFTTEQGPSWFRFALERWKVDDECLVSSLSTITCLCAPSHLCHFPLLSAPFLKHCGGEVVGFFPFDLLLWREAHQVPLLSHLVDIPK
jgi:hypothetical protein